jgi:hypothetical protein
MAYSDYGAFLPAEALYTEPGAYSGVLRGEALKRASYLSEMDRFYEELRESSERFEKQYALAERELEFTEEQALWEREFTEEQAEKQEGFEEARFAHEEKIARIGSSARGSSAQLQYDLGLKELDFRREVEEKQLSQREEWDIASDYLSKISAPTSKRVTLTEGQKIAPIVSGEETTEVQTLFTPKLDKFGYRTY